MNEIVLPLDELEVGKYGMLVSLLSHKDKRRRMLDLGLIRGTIIEVVQRSPAGDPTAYFIRGTLIALRNEDAAKCLVKSL